MVIWLIGLSGAGKSTIGRALYEHLKQEDPATVLVDGDEIRGIFRQDATDAAYSIEGRRENATRIREICAWLDRQGITVVCCILSIFEESHQWNRANYSEYFEVYVSVPMDVATQRQPKDLYGRALRGETRNVVGVDIAFTPPASPDLVIDNGPTPVKPTEAAARILSEARRKFAGCR